MPGPEQVGLVVNGQRLVIPAAALCARLGVDALVRLHPEDFGLLGTRAELVHFNLGTTSNQVGKRYAVVPIVAAGRRGKGVREVAPVVDPGPARRGICTEVIQGLPLRAVTPAQFADSLPNIRNPEELAAGLLRRYRRLFPDQSDADLLARGCALTRLRFPG